MSLSILMKLAIITHVQHIKHGNHYYGYAPYIREMKDRYFEDYVQNLNFIKNTSENFNHKGLIL